MTTTTTVTDKEIEQIERLYEIVKEGRAAIRDFYAAYDEQKKKEDELRRRRKPN